MTRTKRVTQWAIRTTNLLTKSPCPSTYVLSALGGTLNAVKLMEGSNSGKYPTMWSVSGPCKP